MTQPLIMTDRTLFCSDYVNQPYPRVRDAILANPGDAFREATAGGDRGTPAGA